MEHPVAHHEILIKQYRIELDDHEDRIRSIETISAGREEQIKTLYITVGEIKQMVDGIRKDIMELKQRPAKRWDDVVGYGLAAAVAGFVGWVLRG